MPNLKELAHTRQIPGEPRRRWFCSTDLDLIVWVDERDDPVGFQLCYEKHLSERAITWREGRGYDHAAVDTGDGNPAKHKSTPILVAEGGFDRERVTAIFEEAAGELPNSIRRFVTDRLVRYPEE